MIGIDISDRSVKVVRLSNDKDRRLVAFGWHAIPDGIIEKGVIRNTEAMQEHVLNAMKECHLKPGAADAVVASIPEAESFLRVAEIPAMDEDEVDEAVRWEVAQHIPFGLDKVYLDWQWVNRQAADGRQEVLVGAAEKAVVEQLTRVLLALDLDVAALELESQAFIRSLISQELRQKEGLLVVDFGGAATNVVIHDRGTIRFTATLQKGAHDVVSALPAEEQARMDYRLQNADKLKSALASSQLKAQLNALVVEIHGIVEFYTSQNPQHKVSEILLTGGGSNAPALSETFLSVFDNVHVQRGNPWVNIIGAGRPAHLPMSLTESVHYSTAVGLALRPVEQ